MLCLFFTFLFLNVLLAYPKTDIGACQHTIVNSEKKNIQENLLGDDAILFISEEAIVVNFEKAQTTQAKGEKAEQKIVTPRKIAKEYSVKNSQNSDTATTDYDTVSKNGVTFNYNDIQFEIVAVMSKDKISIQFSEFSLEASIYDDIELCLESPFSKTNFVRPPPSV